MWKILFEGVMYVMAACLIIAPMGLALFTIFLMLTYPTTDEEIIEHGHWMTDEELDQFKKNR